MVGVGISNCGRERSRNEDSYLVRLAGDKAVLAVADGMGGHVAGDVASSLAVAVVERFWEEKMAGLPEPSGSNGKAVAAIVANLIQEANRQVYERAAADPAFQGMGTTLTVGFLEKGRLVVGHVGDSRAYLLEAGGIRLLTADHSLLEQMIQEGLIAPEEAQRHPQRHILTRALGTTPDVTVDLVEQELSDGAILLFCTDGLTSLVRDEELLAILREETDLQSAASRLVDLANERGGHDNITVVLATGIGKREAS